MRTNPGISTCTCTSVHTFATITITSAKEYDMVSYNLTHSRVLHVLRFNISTQIQITKNTNKKLRSNLAKRPSRNWFYTKKKTISYEIQFSRYNDGDFTNKKQGYWIENLKRINTVPNNSQHTCILTRKHRAMIRYSNKMTVLGKIFGATNNTRSLRRNWLELKANTKNNDEGDDVKATVGLQLMN